ncbi:MAG: bifunctional hydroxymethylpyrimidine kinase/phosphomethylpyrimidine kinase [Bacteroidetes bacterium]|nr:bifunctional hydroxymethylpyrimidine kinase/phosphomethylpyrimidine kinase [Bacteroidota bacterium]
MTQKKLKDIKRVLTIAGSDSSAGAGIQADLKAITACGGYAMTAITAITAQNTEGVREIETMSASIVREQIYAVAEDIGIDAIKIGMLPTKEIVDVVIEAIKHYKIKNVVLDPVMVATSGDMLVGGDVAKHIIKNLMPLSTVVTPNTPECKFITGMNIIDTNLYDIAARHMMFLGAKNILIKSGHINSDTITDVLFFENGKKASFPFKKIDTKNTHGTGCSLSSAIACYLAQGYSLEVSVEKAEMYIHEAIKEANYKIGNGHGPINHFYSFIK